MKRFYILGLFLILTGLSARAATFQNWATTNSNPTAPIANGGTGNTTGAQAVVIVTNFFINGAPDDTKMVQAAANYWQTNGGRLYFPGAHGPYRMNGTITFTNWPNPNFNLISGPSYEIFGDGQGASILFNSLNNGSNMFQMTGISGGNYPFKLYIHDLSFYEAQGVNTNSAGIVINVVNSSYLNNSSIVRCSFSGFGVGLHSSMEDVLLDTCDFDDNWIGFWSDPALAFQNFINNVTLMNCTVTQGAQSGVLSGNTNILNYGFVLGNSVGGYSAGVYNIIGPSINMPAGSGTGILLMGGGLNLMGGHFEMTGGGPAIDTSQNGNIAGLRNYVLMQQTDIGIRGSASTNAYPIIVGTNTQFAIRDSGTITGWSVQSTTGGTVKMFTNAASIFDCTGAQQIKADVFTPAGVYQGTTNASFTQTDGHFTNLWAGSAYNFTFPTWALVNNLIFTNTGPAVTVANDTNGGGIGMTFTGGDNVQTVIFTNGGSPVAGHRILTVTFGTAKPVAPSYVGVCNLSVTDSALVGESRALWFTNFSTGGYEVWEGTTALSATTTYVWAFKPEYGK